MSESPALAGAEVAITGRLLSMSRAAAVERVATAGAHYVREPGPATGLLVVGEAAAPVAADGRIPRNLERFRELKRQGSEIRLIGEPELLRLLDAREELAALSRLYTAAQVSRLAEVCLAEVRSWIRRGLLQPARQSNRLPWFEFTDIVLARNLSRLTSSGVPPAVIHRSLAEIARWMPGEQRALGRLEAWESSLRVRLADGGLAEPSGQRVMEFQVGPSARLSSFPGAHWTAADWRAAAEEAEAQGDLEASADGYLRALESGPDADTLFSLGNVLYELGRPEDAAGRYRQAIRHEPDFAEAWNNLGNALAALHHLDAAIEAYEHALSLEPGYADAHCNLATTLERAGRSAEAAAHRGACLRAAPSEEHLRVLRPRDGDGTEE